MDFVEVAPDESRLDEIYPVVRELRDHITLQEFRERYTEGHPGGYRLVALFDEDECRAVAGYRVMTNLVRGRVLYVDDLVTVGAYRSRGYGKRLNDHLTQIARDAGCDHVALDSGTQRTRAHRFYLREGYEITSFHFGRPLS